MQVLSRCGGIYHRWAINVAYAETDNAVCGLPGKFPSISGLAVHHQHSFSGVRDGGTVLLKPGSFGWAGIFPVKPLCNSHIIINTY